MFRLPRLLTILVLVALVFSACQPIQQVPTTQPISATTLERFVEGAPVRLAVGLAVGPDDNLYVGSQWTREVVVLHPDTGEIIKHYGPSDGVDIPCDLAFGLDGSLYASMYPGFEGDGVMRMTPDGKVTGTPILPMDLARHDHQRWASLCRSLA